MTKRSTPQLRSEYPKAARGTAERPKKSNTIVLTIKDACASIKAWLSNKTKGLKTTMKKNTNTNETAAPKQTKNKGKKGNGILGMLMLLVVLSIAYSSYVVWFGTTGLVPKIMLAPQMTFAAAIAIYAFWKATK